MTLPNPEPGLVIPYGYLWRAEQGRGLDEGGKTRPAVIILAVRRQNDGKTWVAVAPITHSPPRDATIAREIPADVKRRLGLDDARSWVILDEINDFIWPGFDLRPVPGDPGRFAYGFLPPNLFAQISTSIVRMIDLHQTRIVNRD